VFAVADGRGAAHAPGGAVGLQRVSVAPSHFRIGVASAAWLSPSQPVDKRLEKPRRRQRRVALKVHHHVDTVAQKAQRLGAAFGAVAAGVRGHHHIGAKTPGGLRDAIVVGCDVDRIEAPNLLRRAPCTLDQAARHHHLRRAAWPAACPETGPTGSAPG
jgi:hypothetical protein